MYYINKSVSPHVYCLDSRINGYTYTDILVGVHGNECCNQRKIKTIGCNSGFDVSLMDLILTTLHQRILTTLHQRKDKMKDDMYPL